MTTIETESDIEFKLPKPCKDLGYCPYGILVEELPVATGNDLEHECGVFGHLCPVFVCADAVVDGEEEDES